MRGMHREDRLSGQNVSEQPLKIQELALLIVALALMTASSIFVHETGNRLLGMGTAFGFFVHVRALSCAFNIAGVVAGFAFAIFAASRLADKMKTLPFWIGFFILQGILIVAFYVTLVPNGEATLTCLVQFAIGACGALFFATCMRFSRFCDFRTLKAATVIAMATCIAVAYGVLGALGVLAHTAVIAGVHFGIVILSAASFLVFAFAHPRGHAAFVSNSEPFIQTVSTEKTDAGVHPTVFLLIVLFAYGLVFGVMHVIPLGLPSIQLPRIVPNLIGVAFAAGLLYVSVPNDTPTTTLVWNRIYRIVFPFVVLAALLIPFTSESDFIASLAFVESAQYYFIMLLATACWTICHTTGVSSYQLFSYALLVYNSGFIVGDLIGAAIHDAFPLNSSTFEAIGIFVFLLTVIVTFNANSEKYAKTARGVLPKEEPKALYDRRLHERCEELADKHSLTTREREVLALLAEGKKPKEISVQLVISLATVRTHVQGVYNKLDVHSADDLAKLIRKQE